MGKDTEAQSEKDKDREENVVAVFRDRKVVWVMIQTGHML